MNNIDYYNIHIEHIFDINLILYSNNNIQKFEPVIKQIIL